jgi:trimeric autotransporter adhesin
MAVLGLPHPLISPGNSDIFLSGEGLARFRSSLGRGFPVCLVAAALVLGATSVAAQVVDTTLWVTNGSVNAIVRTGNTIYVGGNFTDVGPYTGGGVPLDVESGGPVYPFPKVSGHIYAAISDNSGGWYVGGLFSAVGGQPRSNLARILADGSVAAWNPDADGSVEALALSGGTVYAGGSFTIIGGQARNRIAALDATTGSPAAWNPDANGAVHALAVSGNTVYACGDFGGPPPTITIGGQSRDFLAALDATTGSATAWNPTPTGTADPRVYALVVSGSTVYVGGGFSIISGQSRRGLAALNASSGAATSWNPAPGGPWPAILALALSGNTIYVGGDFATMGGQTRNCIAALDATSGSVTGWNPNAGAYGRVCALAVSGSTICAGGDFTVIGGQPRRHIAELDATTGAATAWNPTSSGRVLALAVSGSAIYAGGEFAMVGGQARRCVAALDGTTGVATAWNPNANGIVSALAVNGGTVYAGGGFTSIGGQARIHVAALDGTTGAATTWDPNANGNVNALLVSGSTVYAGGLFTNIGGQPRNYVAALDLASGTATPFDPNAGNAVYALASNGGTIYAGGVFSSIGVQTRNGIAALDATTGTATAWDPSATGSVVTLVLSGSTVYAGGSFSNIGGQARNRIAALDTATGTATAWNPSANGSVATLAVSGGTVYAGGSFSNIGGQARKNIAALDATSGTAHPSWTPNANNAVVALAANESRVYAGGSFTSIGGQPQSYFAAVGDLTTGTLLARFDAEVQTEGVLLRWQFGDPVRVVQVERAERETGPWTSPSLERRDEGELTLALDRSAEAGSTYWYRLSVSLGDGTQTTVGPIRAELPARIVVSGLTCLAPNPSSGTTRIEYVVAQREKMRLSVVDVAGRELEVLVEGSPEPGRYTVVWDGHRGRAPLPAGLYFLRWQSTGRAMQQRIMLIR